MLVLFDNGTPRTLARFLIDRHTVTEARPADGKNWRMANSLNRAKAAGFEVLVTTDKNLGDQQNLAGRTIAIVVLGQGRWTLIKPHVDKVIAAVNAATPGSFTEVNIPYE